VHSRLNLAQAASIAGAPLTSWAQAPPVKAMRIVFEDGTSEECSPTDQRQISVSDVVFYPSERIPKHLKRVWDSPATYAKLAVVRCNIIQPKHYVMTDAGLKRVARVER
jgi:hypothetical protein